MMFTNEHESFLRTSNIGSSRALWSGMAETTNSQLRFQDTILGRRRTALRAIAAVGFVCAMPISVNVRAGFDLLGVTANASHASGLLKSGTVPQKGAGHDVRDTYPLVRQVFGGTMSQTASFYGVSRKTLYQWLGSEETPRARDRQLRRSATLFRVAEYAVKLLGSDDFSSTQVSEHVELNNLLSADSLNEQAVLFWLRGVARSASDEGNSDAKPSLASRLADAGAVRPPGKEDLDLIL